MDSSIRLALRLWGKLPALVRAVIVGELVVMVGGLPELLLAANLKLSSRPQGSIQPLNRVL